MGAGRMAVVLALVLAGCASRGDVPARPVPEAEVRSGSGPAVSVARPIPAPVVPSRGFQRAIQAGTRTSTGEPGDRYWQQWVDYDIDARVDESAKTLRGSERITYHNRSPYRLSGLVFNILQNYHAPGVERKRSAPVTGGATIDRVSFEGTEIEGGVGQNRPGWSVEGTLMYVTLPRPVVPNGIVELEVEWTFPIPERGASARMGHTGDELLYLAYWFPQVAVFDDVIGWHADPFRGNAEFYSDFGSYRVTIDAPEGWLVMSTGTLENPDDVLAPDVAERLWRAESSDTVVHVVAHEVDGSATADSPTGRLQWEFAADSVRDVAFAVMRNHAWDAARAEVGDRNGDGRAEYARVDAFWRASASRYDDAWRYAQHSVEFLSEFTGLAYPWPHMSVFEGAGIIGGGMEYPMMTLVGSYETRSDTALYGVIAHEIAHMWVPMTLNSNERRYAWLDEGTTSFNDNAASAAFYPERDAWSGSRDGYLQAVMGGWDAPIMRWSDMHRSGDAYSIASYSKPAEVLRTLRHLLGEETFMEAYHAFYDRWAFRHPYPWDLFNTFEDVAGRELDWFWRAWYHESSQEGEWYLDRAVSAVERLPGGETRITIADEGWIPMPVPLRITRADGEVLERTIPVDRWLTGADRATMVVPEGSPVQKVVIDPDALYPELDRSNDVWQR